MMSIHFKRSTYMPVFRKVLHKPWYNRCLSWHTERLQIHSQCFIHTQVFKVERTERPNGDNYKKKFTNSQKKKKKFYIVPDWLTFKYIQKCSAATQMYLLSICGTGNWVLSHWKKWRLGENPFYSLKGYEMCWLTTFSIDLKASCAKKGNPLESQATRLPRRQGQTWRKPQGLPCFFGHWCTLRSVSCQGDDFPAANWPPQMGWEACWAGLALADMPDPWRVSD